MARKKITLGDVKEEVPATSEDAAAAVVAPGQEAFKTPDVSKPATVSDISEGATERFADGNVDWNQALEDADDEPDNFPVVEPELDPDSPVEVQAVTESDDEPVPAPAVALEVDPTEAVAAPVDEAVIEDNDFEPAVDVDPPAERTPEELSKDYTEKRELAIGQVSERYQLTEEQRDQVLTNPEEFLPRMAAQVYVDVYESVLGAVSQMLPERVNNINAEYAANQEKTKQFFEKWPALKTSKGLEEVTRIGKVYRNLNQGASSDEFINNVGIQASLALGLELPGMTVVAPAPPEEAPAFHPAGSGAVSDAIPIVTDARESSNQFERMNATWDD